MEAVCSFEASVFFSNYTALQPRGPHYITAVGTSNPTLKHLVNIQVSLLCEPSCQVDNWRVGVSRRAGQQIGYALDPHSEAPCSNVVRDTGYPEVSIEATATAVFPNDCS